MKVEPKIEDSDDLKSFIKHYGKELEHEAAAGGLGGAGARPKMYGMSPGKTGGHHYPRISTFYGEENKGEVSWQTFKFEIESLKVEGVFADEQILLGIRRAVKGNASDILRRLGTGVSIHAVMDKLESTFGNIECEEIALRKFYACQQESTETVSS